MLRRAAALATGFAARAVGPRTFAPAVSHVPHLPVFDERRNELAGTRGFAADSLAAHIPANISAAVKNPSAEIYYDETVHKRYPVGDPSKRAFTYFVLTGGRMVYASAIRLAVLKFVLSMSVDLGKIEPGQSVTVKWRGKPVFIRRRLPAEVAKEEAVKVSDLRDQQTDAERVVNPEWLIVIGVCTHLGCVPLPGAGDYGGWFCPCHGSHYDVSGRIRKGPAPYNLEVPQYKFLDETKVLIG